METTAPTSVPQEDNQVIDKSIMQEEVTKETPELDHSSEEPIRNEIGASEHEQPANDEQTIHEGLAQFTMEKETGKASSHPDVDASRDLTQMAQAKTPLVNTAASQPNNEVPSSSSTKRGKKSKKWRDRARQGASNPRQGNPTNEQPSERSNVPVQVAGITDHSSPDIWLTVNSWFEEKEPPSLSQQKYLRMRNTNATVLVIKKYIVKKNPDMFATDDEVEVIVAGQVMKNEFTLHQLRELWLKSLPSSELFVGRAGDSAEKTVMPVYYASKSLLANSQLSEISDPVEAPVQQGSYDGSYKYL